MRFLLALLTLFLATPAIAQEEGPPCAPFDVVERFHAERLQETRVAQGILGDELLVIFASPHGETWSAVLVSHEGIGCLAAQGAAWQIRSDPAPVPEEAL